jgi:hypothetical protein
MGFVSWLEGIGAKIHNLFTSHEAALQTIASDLQATATGAVAIATAAGETKVVPILSGIADGAGKISTAIQQGAAATDTTEAVSAVTGLASGLVTSGDIGVKDAATQNQIGLVLTKVNNVAAASQAAVAASSDS